MKVTFILGNGFDINIGLDTRYKDFYHYFSVQHSMKIMEPLKHEKLMHMIKKENDINWADLELLFASKIRYFESFIELKNEKIYLENALRKYLEGEQNRVTTNDTEELRNDWNKIVDYYCRYSDKCNQYEVSFLTLNYTNVIDKMICAIGNENSNYSIKYNTPMHLHGELDDLIFGVGDKTQYDNSANYNGDELEKIMLKPILNNSIRSEKIEAINETIQTSDLIVIFGASLGSTDKIWWEKVVNWLNKNNNGKLLVLCNSLTEEKGATAIQQVFEDYENKFSIYTREYNVKGQIEYVKAENDLFKFENAISVAMKNKFFNLTIDCDD